MDIKVLLFIIAGPGFLISMGAYFYAQVRLKPRDDELDDYYWEVEDMHQGLIKYNKWSRTALLAAAVSALLFTAAVFI